MPGRNGSLELLNLLRLYDSVVSGEMLSRQLGVSRTAVWKQVSALRTAGYRIDAVPSQGYRLLNEPELLSEKAICGMLDASRLIGKKIICTPETGSTNSDLFRMAEEGAVDGVVLLAERQTSGKGRLGRRWESPEGVNLYCSLLLRPDIPPFEAPQLTFLSAVAVVRAIQSVTDIRPDIKWPNDILINGRKVAGLLNEMNAETDRVLFVVLGIGVNLNMRGEQFPAGLRYPATSLFLETGTVVDRNFFAAILLKELDKEYKRFIDSGFAPARGEWASYCNAAGRELQVDFGSNSVRGLFAGLDHDGALLIKLPNGNIERILGGDLTVL